MNVVEWSSSLTPGEVDSEDGGPLGPTDKDRGELERRVRAIRPRAETANAADGVTGRGRQGLIHPPPTVRT
jgi:hypothetical protein